MNTIRRTRKTLGIRTLLGVFFAALSALHAGTVTVTNTTDDVAAPANGSLRKAIATAVDGDVIVFSPAVTGTITLAGAEIVLDKSLTITGPGASTILVSANSQSRVFTVATGKTVQLSGLTIRNGSAPGGDEATGVPAGDGGGILNNGTLTMSGCVVESNKTTGTGTSGANGGGIANTGTLTISSSLISGNQCTPASSSGGCGGGIYNSGSISLTDCTVSANSIGTVKGSVDGGGNGGGMFSTGLFNVTRCTFSGNKAGDSNGAGAPLTGTGSAGSGGGIHGDGTCTNSTFANNITGIGYTTGTGRAASGAGGAIHGNVTLVSCTIASNAVGNNSAIYSTMSPGGGVAGSGVLRNCIVSGNIAYEGRTRIVGPPPGNEVSVVTTPATGFDLYGAFTSDGHNLIGKLDGSTGIVAGVNGDIAGTIAAPLDAVLSPIGSNGGPTKTIVLLPGSPALDAGDDTLTGTDQRGLPRLVGSHVDIGAVETDPSIFTLVSFTTSATNVDETAGTALITVQRTGRLNTAFTVAYSTSDFGTTAGADYTITNGTLSFAAGETEKTISVPIIDDSAIEVGEAFRVVISAPSGAFLGAISTITVAINDNDDRGAFEFSTASSAVAESVGNVMLTIVRDSAIGSASVSYATVAGTALEGSDFTATSATATFAEGVTQQTIAIPIVSDSLYEELENFTVQLSAPTIGARLGTQATHTIGIQNDDPDPGVIVFTAASSIVQEAADSIVLNISRNSTIGTVSVHYAASGVTATAGSDFTAVSGTVTFAAGQSAQTITVPIANDTVFELDETFTVQLSAPTIGARIGAVGTHTVTIQSDEAPPAFSFAAASSIVEETAGSIVVTVSRQGDTATACSVAYGTASGSATAGADFTTTSGVLDFPSAQTQRTIVVPITADSTVENDETFSIALSSPTSGAVLGATSTHTVTIRGTTKLGFASNVFSVGENDGTAQITVVRTGSTVAAASVAYSTSAGTAADGTDFTGTSGTLSFAAGETEKTITVPVLTDAIPEADETFTITLASPTGGVLGSITTAQVTIENVVAKIKGSYHGLARRAAGTGLGGITIASTEKDRISGKLLLGGTTHKFSGTIDAGARFMQTLSVKVGTAKVPRVLALARSHDGSRYSGTFTLEDATVYNIDARIDATRDDAPVKADYNATLEATELAGVLRTSVKTTGKIVLAGSLPDGTTISGGSALAKDGTTAIFIPLYTRKLGYLGGLATLASGGISGPLSWEKPAALRGPHAGGFDDQSLALSGALYTTTLGLGVLDDFETTIGHGNGYFTGGGLAADVVLPITVSGRNKIEFPGAAGKTTKLKMDAATGFISGTFTDVAGKRHAVKAIAIPQTGAGNDTALGFFLSDTTSGIVELVAE